MANVLHVDRSAVAGAGDGSSWPNAYAHLQDALAAAQPGDEIWVAASVYYPDEGTEQTADIPQATFSIPQGVRVFGGFNGSETDRSERDPDLHLTVLSGDLQQDDEDPEQNRIAERPDQIRGVNADTIVLILNGDAATQVDGFVISAGHAHSAVGGQHAIYGGGMVIEGGNPVVSRCWFIGSEASSGGGALWVNQGDPFVVSCLFIANRALRGGGMQLSGTTNACHIANCVVSDNESESRGGGIYVSSSGAPTIVSCTIVGNRSERGGGVFNNSSTATLVGNTIIWGNEAGGVKDTASASVYSLSSSTPGFSHCIIANSSGALGPDGEMGADLGGNQDTDPGLIRITGFGLAATSPFLRPHAGSSAFDTGDAGMIPFDPADLDRDGDRSELLPLDFAGGLRVFGSAPDVGAFEAQARIEITEYPDAYSAEWSLNPEPVPEALDLSTVFAGDIAGYELSSVSPPGIFDVAISYTTGIVSLALQAGQLGVAEVVAAAISPAGGRSYVLLEISAFPSIVFVDATAPVGGNGATWSQALRDLGDALALGSGIREIWAADGVYLPDRGVGRKRGDTNLTFDIRHGVSIYGGFEGTESTKEQRDPSRFLTILSGDLDRDDRDLDGNRIAESADDIRGENSKLIVSVAPDQPSAPVLDGLVITAGSGTDATHGGITIRDSSAVLRQCLVSGNSAGEGAGASILVSDPPTISDCEFRGNCATGDGGAIRIPPSAILSLPRCSFHSNTAARGGAIYGSNGELTLTDCTFTANKAIAEGGALRCLNTRLRIKNCAFRANIAGPRPHASGGALNFSGSCEIVACEFTGNTSWNGGAIQAGSATGCIVNCVFSGHDAGFEGGVFRLSSSPLSIINCRIAGNRANQGGAVFSRGSSPPAFINCVFAGNYAEHRGGALYNLTFSQPAPPAPRFVNSVLWKNSAHGGAAFSGPVIYTDTSNHATPPSFSHCLVDTSGGSENWNSDLGTDLGNNLDSDPQFILPIDHADAPTDLFDLRFRRDSPAFDRGDSAALPVDLPDLDNDGDLLEPLPIDLEGRPRISGAAVDLGPYEIEPGPASILGVPPIHLLPLSGLNIDVLDLSQIFDGTAQRFEILAHHPSGIVSASVDEAGGTLTIDVQPDRYGRTVVVAAASDAQGRTSLISFPVDVFPTHFHVDADATGKSTGLTWNDAFPTLQDAMRAAVLPGYDLEVWIAAGLYFPDEGAGQTNGDIEAAFEIRTGFQTRLYGGFVGAESQRSQRDPALHRTILSGDLDQDDLNDDGNFIAERHSDVVGTNSIRLLRATDSDATTILDGLTLAAANLGIITTRGNFSVRNTRFAHLRSTGIWSLDSELMVTDSHFQGIEGGGIQGIYGTSTALNCANTIFENLTPSSFQNSGGAVRLLYDSSAQFTDCSFRGNISLGDGGAIETDHSALTVQGCEFIGNRGADGLYHRGGAISFWEGSSLDVVRCSFLDNHALPGAGGAIYARMFEGGIASIRECRFQGNSAIEGGAFKAAGRNAVITISNCLFAGNYASALGGAASLEALPVSCLGCTFAENRAAESGGALHLSTGTEVSNCIVWNNSAGSLTSAPSASVHNPDGGARYRNCLLANSGGSASWNSSLGLDDGGNLDLDPRFLVQRSPADAPHLAPAGSFSLTMGSPAINAGTNAAVTSGFDLSGRPRIVNGLVDMGALEAQGDELDSDADGLSDAYERAHTSPPSASALNPLEDLDSDGWVNLLEFAFGLDPRAPDPVSPVSHTLLPGPGGLHFSITYRRNLWAAHHLTVEVERSTDLGLADHWNAGETTIVRTVPLDFFTELVTERSITPMAEQADEQLRVRVTSKSSP